MVAAKTFVLMSFCREQMLKVAETANQKRYVKTCALTYLI